MENRYAQRARSLVGTRFRAQGRDVFFGLDCAGLVIAVYSLPPHHYRHDYELRGDHRRELEAALLGGFRRIRHSHCRPGDVMLLGVASDQLHLAIKSEEGFIHADARLGRVVETPGDPCWKLIAVYRRRVGKMMSA